MSYDRFILISQWGQPSCCLCQYLHFRASQWRSTYLVNFQRLSSILTWSADGCCKCFCIHACVRKLSPLEMIAHPTHRHTQAEWTMCLNWLVILAHLGRLSQLIDLLVSFHLFCKRNRLMLLKELIVHWRVLRWQSCPSFLFYLALRDHLVYDQSRDLLQCLFKRVLFVSRLHLRNRPPCEW